MSAWEVTDKQPPKKWLRTKGYTTGDRISYYNYDPSRVMRTDRDENGTLNIVFDDNTTIKTPYDYKLFK